MTSAWAIYRRELLALWVTPLAWVLLFVFLLLQGLSFSLVVTHFASFVDISVDQGPLQTYFSSAFVHLSLLLICPVLTMKSFAEERRSGTIELTLTAPTSSLAVVLGKLLSVVTTFGVLWAPTLLYAVILRNTGSVSWSLVWSSYAGIVLLGTTYLAIGLLMSALTKSQLIAALLTTLVLFGFFLLGLGEQVLDDGVPQAIGAHLSPLTQLDELSRGVVDSRRVVLNVSLLLLATFASVRAVESWRWAS